ncbi:MAG: protease modulator HflC [Desulfobacteraceae bacterium]|nr:protease modulator HflC [Desulfobacteraceae bacterium]
MKFNKYIVIVVVLVIAGFVLLSSAYTVDETEQVVITQFGKVMGDPVTEPGLNFRIPFVQQVNFFPKNIQAWDGEPGQIPTLDKTYIWVDTFARWRITDPVAFFRTVTDVRSAMGRLDDIINPAVRNAVTSYELIETVRNSDREMTTLDQEELDEVKSEAIKEVVEKSEEKERRQYDIKVGRARLTKMMLTEAQPKLDKFGIELIDVKVKRVNYVEGVRRSVYNRMIAERKQMAEKIRSMGQGEARKIEGDKERDLLEIQSEAYRTAEEIKGNADAQATQIYAEAYGKAPEFYSFLKSMDVYTNSLEGSDLILSTDSEFLQYLKQSRPSSGGALK